MTIQFSDLTAFRVFQPKRILCPYELIEELPTSSFQRQLIANSRNAIQNILQGKDSRFLLISGPCSIHDFESAIEYASRLKKLSQSLDDVFFVVMRVYFEKPRTAGGWKGLTFDPHLDGSNDIMTGHSLTRQLLLAIAEMGLPVAAEFLEPTSSQYFGDLISWGCIGARTVESQVHRQMVSGLSMPIAFKNTTSGNIEAAVNGIYAAAQAHTFMATNPSGRLSVVNTEGNPWGHLMLRGAESKPNYEADSIAAAVKSLQRAELLPFLLVDCSHDNSYRTHENQPKVFKSVVQQILAGNKHIKGLSLESHLHSGKQPFPQDLSDLKYGVSLTDSCLGWEATEELLSWGHSVLKNVCLLLILIVGLSSCQSRERLCAFSEYVTCDQLASFHVETPDPALDYPSVGQRLFIKWNLSKDYEGRKLICKLHMRFKDHSEATETLVFNTLSGGYEYLLLNERYFAHGGIQTYKLDLYVDGILEEEWRHQMWVDYITFPESD